MKIDLKAWLALMATLAIGVVLGLLLNGALNRRRMMEIDRMRGPGGFVAEMERLIVPHDSVQRNQLRPYFEATDRRNREIVDGARGEMRAELDSLRARIAPFIDKDQADRLEGFARRGPRDDRRHGPPGLGGPPPPR